MNNNELANKTEDHSQNRVDAWRESTELPLTNEHKPSLSEKVGFLGRSVIGIFNPGALFPTPKNKVEAPASDAQPNTNQAVKSTDDLDTFKIPHDISK